MKNLNYQTGKLGEQIGRQHLIKKGYQIIKSNFQTRFGEIDLIAVKDKRLIFIEVKLKIGDQFGTPEEMINKTKLTQIKKTAEYFLQTNPEIAKKYPTFQIDAVCLVLDDQQKIKRINHWENIDNEMV